MNREDVLKGMKVAFHSVAPEIDFDAIDLKRPLRSQVEIDSFDFFRIIQSISKTLAVNVPDTLIQSSESLEELINGISETPSHHPPQSTVQ